MRIFFAKAIRIPYTWPEKTRFVLEGFARVVKDKEKVAKEQEKVVKEKGNVAKKLKKVVNFGM